MSKPYLCGGTFFVLLLQAKKQATKKRNKAHGGSDGLTGPNILMGLIRVANPQFEKPGGNSFESSTSAYKSCQDYTSTYLPFDDPAFVDDFDRKVTHSYPEALQSMQEFIDRYIETGSVSKRVWLVQALLELIDDDGGIDDSDMFFINSDGTAVDKRQMLSVDKFDLQSFLLGIWHYIVKKRPQNILGRETFEDWHRKPTASNSPWKFTSDIGRRDRYRVTVNILSPVKGNAPQVTEEGSCDSALTKQPVPDNRFAQYLERAQKKYSSVKTLLHEQPQNFDDFYVCNHIVQHISIPKRSGYYQTKIYPDATAERLSSCSDFIVLSGTGGLGKSMMMRHLLLDAATQYAQGGRLPIFFSLKDYSLQFGDLLTHLYSILDNLGGDLTLDEFQSLLSAGKCLLLFDGLDEISSDLEMDFERELDTFTDRYPENMFIISSRPFRSFHSLQRFTVLQLQPFDKQQALELIDKLDFRSDEPELKAKFRRELDSSLFFTHKEFATNPLLLTIMLMTYEQFAEIPSKMHRFYHEAYITLAQKHDANKVGYKRMLRTKLDTDRFADYFAEFCARSYTDEKYSLTEEQFKKHFDALRVGKADGNVVRLEDFIYDLTNHMCLMYFEGGSYHFTHRSFQEYFCALFFSRQKDKMLGAIGDSFERKKRRPFGDQTFGMLYDMIPEKVEEYIFQPFLEKLFQECDQEDGYWTFLESQYPVIRYDHGETNGDAFNVPESFLYGFITMVTHLQQYVEDDIFPDNELLLTTKYCYIYEDWKNADWRERAFWDGDYDVDSPTELADYEEVGSDYISVFGDPEIVGWSYEFSVSDVRDDENDEILEILDKDDFPLKLEYEAMRKYLNELKEKETSIGTELFDLL